MRALQHSSRAGSSGGAQISLLRSGAVPRPVPSRRVVAAHSSKWKVFGPTSSYSDGDAEFFRLSNQLQQQHGEWVAPRQTDDGGAALDDDELLLQEAHRDMRKPLYGLTPQQIDALGLSGPRVNTPDPVRVWRAGWAVGGHACVAAAAAGAAGAAGSVQHSSAMHAG